MFLVTETYSNIYNAFGASGHRFKSYPPNKWTCSSVGLEHLTDIQKVTGSTPVLSTKITFHWSS